LKHSVILQADIVCVWYLCSYILHVGFCATGILSDLHCHLCSDRLRHEVGQRFQYMGCWVCDLYLSSPQLCKTSFLLCFHNC